ncbi:P-loop containing nucleoside triphosphate hydrolase protein, partial [Blyttiomyces helicus]
QVILLGDSAVGKSKLIERFLLDDFLPHQLSTYALTLYRHTVPHPFAAGPSSGGGSSTSAPPLTVDFWDTAGQERFRSMHPSYYLGAHACVLVFDVTRKVTYKNLDMWYEELVGHRGLKMPVIVVANKIDADPTRARKSFGFVERRRAERAAAGPAPNDPLPLFFASASDGSNVVSLFREAIRRAVRFKESGPGEGGTFVDEVLKFIEEEGKEGGLFGRADEEDVAGEKAPTPAAAAAPGVSLLSAR